MTKTTPKGLLLLQLNTILKQIWLNIGVRGGKSISWGHN